MADAPTPVSDNPLLEAALRYAARGWHVFPLKPGAKAPLTAHGFKDATTDTSQIRAWWTDHPRANVAIRTGRESGLVVLDVDRHGADDGEASLAAHEARHGSLPATYAVRTANRGRHLYFAYPASQVRSRNKVLLGIDIKSDGGYVVAPPSGNGEGAGWVVAEAQAVAELPASIVALAESRSPAERPARPPAVSREVARGRRYAEVAMKMEIRNLRETPEGARNDTLNRAAFSLGQLVGAGHIERARAEGELVATAALIGLGEREAEATIRSGIEAGMKEPRQIRPRSKRPIAPTPPSAYTDVILIPGAYRDDQDRYIEQSNKDFADQVIGALPPDSIYRKSYIPGELIGSPGDRHWEELRADRVRLIVDEHVKLGAWYTRKQDESAVLVYKPSSKDHAGLVIAGAQQDPRVRDLDLLVNYPVYGPDFRRVEPGWNDGIYYDEPPALRGLKPDRDVGRIRHELDELVVDFPFKDEASRQNFIGLLLTPLVAPAIEGNRPLHLLLSPLERTGKSKLVAEVLGGVVLGEQIPALQITERDEERDKRLLAALLKGDTVMHLDNLPAIVDSPALASMLTAATYQGRILGASRIVCVRNTLTIVGSGNNTECSGEIAKRAVPIQLQPLTAHPELRRDFRHPNIGAYVKRARCRVLGALLGMVENWLARGRPLNEDRLGGFELWSETVGGILAVNGFDRWRTNEMTWRRAADPMGQEWESLVTAWWSRFGKQPLQVAELLRFADVEDCLQSALNQRTPKGRHIAFGRLLRRKVGTPVARWVIRREEVGNHSRYYLEATE